MLAATAGENSIDEAWVSADKKVQLPESLGPGFFAKQGPMPVHHDDNNKRGFHRHYMRGKAILKRGEKTFGTYTKDISRKGIGLLLPVQLLPIERVNLMLSNDRRCTWR